MAEKSEYSAKETKRRFEAALKGARVTPRVSYSDMTPKKPRDSKKKRRANKR